VDALGLTDVMEKAVAPIRETLSSMALSQLEATRLEASQMIRVFEESLPRVDVDALTDFQQMSFVSLVSILEDENLALGRQMLEHVQLLPLVDWSMHYIHEATDMWRLLDEEVKSLRDELDLSPAESGVPPVAVIAATIAALLAVEVESSRILLDFATFSVEAMVALLQLLWQAASLPGVSAPVGTIGGLAGILGLALYLRDRQRRSR
jgi:hypothetical protein